MSAPLTLAGLVARLRAEDPPCQIRTHSLFHLRAALRGAQEFGTIENAPTLEEVPGDMTRATLCGVPVVEDHRIAVGVVVVMVREILAGEIHGKRLPERTAAIAGVYAPSARGFADRMGFLGQ